MSNKGKRFSPHSPWAAALVLALTALSAWAGSSVDDLKAMQGKWSVSIVEADGKAAGEELAKLNLELLVKGDEFQVFSNDQVISAGKLKLDATKKPRTMDAVNTEGPAKGKVQRAIYEIKGDMMIFVFAKAEADRPTEFKTKEGSGHSVLHYKRLKK